MQRSSSGNSKPRCETQRRREQAWNVEIELHAGPSPPTLCWGSANGFVTMEYRTAWYQTEGSSMEITKEPLGDEIRYSVRGYGPGEIRINDTVYNRSVILARNRLDAEWNPRPVPEWAPDALDPLLAHDPEILLIGTGEKVHLLGTPFLAHALHQGVGLEVMDTAAACRTFNILAGEGRRVVAGLVIEQGS